MQKNGQNIKLKKGTTLSNDCKFAIRLYHIYKAASIPFLSLKYISNDNQNHFKWDQ